MLHRAIRDPVAPADTDADLAAVERGERHLRLLAEIAEIGMGLVRSLGELAQARVRRELNGEDGAARAEDAAAAFDKMSQTVRRTLALEARLAEGVTLRRQGLSAERAARRAAHKTAVDKAIVIGLHDAWAADCPDAEYHAMVDRLLEDAQEYSRGRRTMR